MFITWPSFSGNKGLNPESSLLGFLILEFKNEVGHRYKALLLGEGIGSLGPLPYLLSGLLQLVGGVDVRAYLLRVFQEHGKVREILPPVADPLWKAFLPAFREGGKGGLRFLPIRGPVVGLEVRERLGTVGVPRLGSGVSHHVQEEELAVRSGEDRPRCLLNVIYIIPAHDDYALHPLFRKLQEDLSQVQDDPPYLRIPRSPGYPSGPCGRRP